LQALLCRIQGVLHLNLHAGKPLIVAWGTSFSLIFG
jgi:hypothetical protein